jgi:hypothetical protein
MLKPPRLLSMRVGSLTVATQKTGNGSPGKRKYSCFSDFLQPKGANLVVLFRTSKTERSKFKAVPDE